MAWKRSGVRIPYAPHHEWTAQLWAVHFLSPYFSLPRFPTPASVFWDRSSLAKLCGDGWGDAHVGEEADVRMAWLGRARSRQHRNRGLSPQPSGCHRCAGMPALRRPMGTDHGPTLDHPRNQRRSGRQQVGQDAAPRPPEERSVARQGHYLRHATTQPRLAGNRAGHRPLDDTRLRS